MQFKQSIWLHGLFLFSFASMPDLSGQGLCRDKSTGVVKWVKEGKCGNGWASINNSIWPKYLRKNSVDSSKIADGSITNLDIAPNAQIAWSKILKPQGGIVGSELADNSITFEKIATDTINSENIAADAVGQSELADNSVDTNAILPAAVTAPKLAAGAVVGGALGTILDGTITNDDIAPNAKIHWSKLDPDSIPPHLGQIPPNSITHVELADNAVDTAALQDSSVTNIKLADNAVTTAKIGNGQVTTPKLATGAVVGGQGGVIADDTITSHDIGLNAVGTLELADNSVDTPALQDNSVTNNKFSSDPAHRLAWSKILLPQGGIPGTDIANEAITVAKVANNAITNAKLADNSVTTAKIDDGTITNVDIHPNAGIDHTKINFTGFTVPANSVGTAQLQNNAVTTSKIGDQQITSIKLAPNSVSGGVGGVIQDGTITNADISATAGIHHGKIDFTGFTLPVNSVGTQQLQDNAVTSSKIIDGTINNTDISPTAGIDHTKINFTGFTVPANSVGTAQIQNNAITTAKIADGQVTAPKLATGAVTGGQGGVIADDTLTNHDIAPNAIGPSELADNSVDTLALQDNSVTNSKFSSDPAHRLSWGKISLPLGGIPGSDLANEGVTTGKIANLAITTAKLADNSVTGQKILDGTVTNLDLATNAVESDELATNSVGQDEIQEGAVTTTEILDGTIEDDDIADDAEIAHTKINFTGFQVGSENIQNGAINDAKIAVGGIGPNKLSATAINNSGMFASGVVNTNALANSSVTKQKLNLDHLNLPYLFWTGGSQGNLNSANFYPISGVSAGATTASSVFLLVPQVCTKLTFRVQLSSAPGTGQSRTFELVNRDGASIDPDGTGPLTKIEVSISGTSTTVAQTYNNVPVNAIQHLALRNSNTASASPSAATWFVVCE